MIWSDDLTGKYSDDNNTNSNSKHLHIMERRRREAGFTSEASASLLQLGSTTASDKVPPAEDYMRALWGVSAN
ncbi:hypothetical protein AGDE_13045 [Angomonas deanei]|uniref:Uncharacterized protein n=1 Tax=Angomonas deanei TaxID=59799 RepID=A0A7G2C9A1_9TRYP|nr:hypothetical protein AGDE_13045 [Angomonas deanei]CAD2215634.1 hypothetical protein, conserved [Angomonas deanei]|eukprot:EPY22821.1 hypothetical protein AGDE_13045 [Angomonas deanei]